MLIPKPLIIALKHKFAHKKHNNLPISEQKMLQEQFLDKSTKEGAI